MIKNDLPLLHFQTIGEDIFDVVHMINVVVNLKTIYMEDNDETDFQMTNAVVMEDKINATVNLKTTEDTICTLEENIILNLNESLTA